MILKKEQGFSLIDLIVGILLASLVVGLSYGYMAFYVKNSSLSEGWMSQEEAGHFIEKFFSKQDLCTETLKAAELAGGVIPGGDFTVDLIQHAPSSTKGMVTGFQDKLSGGIEVSFSPLTHNVDLARLSYTVRELSSRGGDLQERDKSFYVEVLRNNLGGLESCLISQPSQFCEGGGEHILAYDESSLNPVSSSLITEPQPDGIKYKTFTKTNFDSLHGVSCQSYSHCHQGEWKNLVFCYNSCTDSLFSTGLPSFKNLASGTDCSGSTNQTNQVVECDKPRDTWCPAMAVSPPSCSIDLREFCAHEGRSDGACSGTNPKATFSGDLQLPPGNYGDTQPVVKGISAPGAGSIGYISIYARCEYSGEWHIMGLSCDEDPKARPLTGIARNVWGRKNQGGQCLPIYPNPNFSCDTSGGLTLIPGVGADADGPISQEALSVKAIYRNQISDQVAHGVPLRFAYDFHGRNPMAYTASCNASTGKFNLLDTSPHCQQSRERKSKLDMIFVIDNSGSMGAEQINLANNLDVFFDQFLNDNVDTHIAVITTDFENRLGGSFLCNKPGCAGTQKSIPNIKTHLKTAVRAGTSGDTREELFKPVVRVKSSLPDFFRRDAVLALFFLTDEDDYTSCHRIGGQVGGTCFRANETAYTDSFVEFLFSGSSLDSADPLDTASGLNKNPDEIIAFIAVNDRNSQSTYRAGRSCTNVWPPGNLRYFIKKVDERILGAVIPDPYKSPREVDLCDPNFSDKLKVFGMKVAALLQTVEAPQRPASLDMVSESSLPKTLKNSSGSSTLTCP